jgi:hypothetical protein
MIHQFLLGNPVWNDPITVFERDVHFTTYNKTGKLCADILGHPIQEARCVPSPEPMELISGTEDNGPVDPHDDRVVCTHNCPWYRHAAIVCIESRKYVLILETRDGLVVK